MTDSGCMVNTKLKKVNLWVEENFSELLFINALGPTTCSPNVATAAINLHDGTDWAILKTGLERKETFMGNGEEVSLDFETYREMLAELVLSLDIPKEEKAKLSKFLVKYIVN